MTPQQSRDHIDLFHGPPLSVLSDCLRGFLVSKPGHDLIACDFAAIESRVLNWVAGEDAVLEMYRSHGKIYEHNASVIYRVPMEMVTKDQRQIGKVAELALGYGGGVGAFQSMAKKYGVKVTDAFADDIKVAWRKAHPKVVRYWYSVEDAAVQAVSNPRHPYSVGKTGQQVTFKTAGSFLWCRLPSGRVLCYPYPEIKIAKTPWGADKECLTYMGEDTFSHKWERQDTFGGKLTENIVQAISRDLMAEAMLRLELHNYAVVMHVHDEVVCEIPEGFGSVEEMEKLLTVVPDWASGLPLGSEGWRGKRYRK